ncbi:Gamma tubulin complex protein 3 [Cordyceps militaris CM01]|uniref:Gamma tubulin complex protein 3 n=1 Tax=Cordyceps militaris (strain CM01) TaxID=983644 RepID=G3JMZ6_CORMM|nr:Gamma tubulin complex protein 3 [Cordyceps militaris CM01]EGX90178.1 Gamma tubulin complex protein 3 [Cordyceps militaris CM01]
MASDKIATAVDSLIDHLIPTNPDDDERQAQDQHDRCFDLVKSTIRKHSNATVSADVNHASDLIKRKLIQTNPSQALRFSNLYSRLLAVPVLEHKWAILHLLYHLSDSPDPSEPLPLSPVKPSAPNYREAINREATKRERERAKTPSATPSKFEDVQFRESFQPDGSRTAPAADTRPGDTARRNASLQETLLGNYSELNPPETSLLRDLPFTLQGLSSTTLPFSGPDTLTLPATLPLPLVSILHALAEPSLLYRQLDAFCKTPASGLMGQSLRSGIGGELRAYLTLIATLEAQIRRALASVDEGAPRGGIGKAGITLKRCVMWTREATMGLRLMSLVAEESESKRGGQIISLIHGFAATHGDPIVSTFAERLLGTCTRPFYDILRHWIYDGELSDPYQEFFVREQTGKSDPAELKGASNVWEDKYEAAEDMIPSIMTPDFAQKVFLIGKSLNFIRHSCGDALWVEDYSKAASKELRYGDTATIEAWIDEAYKTTMKRLMDLMANKFQLFDHLQALKSYFLLGQGDFIALLMESLAGNLDRPAGAQFRHTLTAQLEHAIRGSNAQFDSPEVLRRLDARMLLLSHGDIGWDCFTLEYKIDAPVDVVVTEWGKRQYLKVFNFLWRIKRVEFSLLAAWRRCMTGARGVLQNADAEVAQTWKTTRAALAEMIHFIGQLQYYILFEVIESSWGELQTRIHKEDCTLDDLIKAHRKYINDITHKGLLGPKKRHPASSGAEEDERTSYLSQLSSMLRLMLEYRDSVDGLYSWSVSDFTRRQEAGVRSSRARAGGGDRLMDDVAASVHDEAVASEFPVLKDRLRHLGRSFSVRMSALLGDLAYQPDVEMRFLGVAMNFNDVYPVRRRSRPAASANTSKG